MTGTELRTRLLGKIVWKATGCTVAITAFFVVYFYLMQNPVFPVRTMPVYSIDHAIPVMEWTTWIYFSLWVYICLPTTLMHTLPALGQFLLGAFILAVMGMSVFLFYPTAVPHWEIDWQQYDILAFLKTSDLSGNACPSMHVGYSVFAALWMSLMLKRFRVHVAWNVFNWFWALAIILSTLTTKQHVSIDVIWGTLFGAVAFVLNYLVMRRMQTQL